ncbi:MAG: hypothetical protein HYT80_00690 [Euryarchaeota archaeon]|nr:hypothetical protein [Euryarchaeota archaeon]
MAPAPPVPSIVAAAPEAAAMPGLQGGMLTSLRLTFASFAMVLRYPLGLLVPLLTMAWTGLFVVLPVMYVFELYDGDKAAFVDFFMQIYAPVAGAIESGNDGAVFGYGILETYLIYAVWLTIVLFGVLFFGTVSLDLFTQQIKRQKPSLVRAFGVAGRNAHRILLLALFNATIFTAVRYLLRRGLKRASRSTKKVAATAVKLLLVAITYVMLPILIYERAGPGKAMNSALDQIRKGWAGIVAGIGTSFVGVWVLFSLVSQGFVGAIVGSLIHPTKWFSVRSPADAFHMLGWDNLSHFLPELVVGAVLFSLSMTVGAAVRATLYWNATTGEVPKGFRSEDLPQVAAPRPFTAVPGVSA